jgi:NAD(P)-dependent dehydrogenase (short-subunit alcohol dehydrogenase family)
MEGKGIFLDNLLKENVSIVTGAGRGLGRVLALALAQAGSDIALTARHQEEIEHTAAEIKALGNKVLSIKADVTKSNDISGMVKRVLSEFGKIDVLVNNAGQNASYAHHKFEDIPENEWTNMIQTNVTGVFLATQIVGRAMLARGSGKVINIASSMAVRATPGRLCYSVSKAAVIQMTRGLAVEWAPHGVTVNCIAPGSLELYSGSFAPGLLDRYQGSRDELFSRLNEERKKRIPLGRVGGLEEVAPLLVFLASSASDYMTGETIFIDGGMAVG